MINKYGRCEVCDSLEECSCFCKCGLSDIDCVCGWTEKDYAPHAISEPEVKDGS